MPVSCFHGVNVLSWGKIGQHPFFTKERNEAEAWALNMMATSQNFTAPNGDVFEVHNTLYVGVRVTLTPRGYPI